MAQASPTKINLACGGVFITGDGWINLDYSAANPAVQRANLLARLPLPDAAAALVYSSHFLEHIPRGQVPGFLAECWRILAPGGVLRLVLPDLDNLCRAYLSHRERGEHEKAEFLVLEMIDLCVGSESGGELGRLYRQLKSAPEQHVGLIRFVRERTGEHLLAGLTAASMLAPGGGFQGWCVASEPASRDARRGRSCKCCPRPFASRTLAWPALANATSGCGISSNCAPCCKRPASRRSSAARRRSGASPVSPSNRWIWTTTVARARAPNQCISRRASPASPGTTGRPSLRRPA